MKSPIFSGICLLVIISILFFSPCKGQEILSLNNCISMALKSNSQYLNAQSREEIANAQVLSSYARFLPSLSFNVGGNSQHQGSLTREYNTAVYKYDENGRPVMVDEKPVVEKYVKTLNSTDPQIRNNFSIGTSIDQVIYDGGRWWNQMRKQYSNQTAREYDTETARLNTITNVQQYYYELLKAQNQLIVLEEAVKLAEEQLNSSNARFETGSVAEIDVLRSQVNLNNQKIQLFTQQNMAEISRANLNTIMGRDSNLPLIITEDSTITENVISLNEALKLAEFNNPSIKSAEEDVERAHYSYKYAKGSLLPTIAMSLNYSRSNPNVQLVYQQINRNYQWTYGLSFSMPFFDGLKTKSDIQTEAYNLKIAEENLTDVKRTVFSNTQEYLLKLSNNLKKINMLKENLTVAEENVRLTRERYNVGVGTLLETIDAQSSYTRSRIDFVASIYDAKILQAQLEGIFGTKDFSK